jgi:hypothetical protein
MMTKDKLLMIGLGKPKARSPEPPDDREDDDDSYGDDYDEGSEADDEGDEDEHDSDSHAAAEDLIRAVKDGDAAAVCEAFRALDLSLTKD